MNKKCAGCGLDHPIEDFAFKNIEKGIRQSACNVCRRKRQQLSYYKHHTTNLKRIKDQKKKNSDWYSEMKSSLCCSICGEYSDECLDFHHLDSNEKDFDVSGLRQETKAVILREIAKCACLCANCHRKFHAGKITQVLMPVDVEKFNCAPVYPHATNVLKG